uniref:WD repeat-containing protein 81 n=1 Tax=Cacopsylla melanoneura TaxID=428564 RepID=A0A8D9AX21_9HEMI
MEHIINDFHVPKNYIIETSSPDRWEILTSRLWLRDLLRASTITNFTLHETLTPNEVYSRLKQKDTFEHPWQRLLVSVIKKKHSSQIIALPQEHSIATPDHSTLSYSETLHYVSVTNYKNLWKQAYKKYNNQSTVPYSNINSIDFNTGVRDILTRLYGCPLVVIDSSHLNCDANDTYECHVNIMPALAIVETKTCFYILQEHRVQHTLQDAVDYSPALLSTNYTRSLFIVYQLLHAMRDLHDRGLILGDVTLADIHVTDNLWIQIQPKITDNIYELLPPQVSPPHHSSQSTNLASISSKTPLPHHPNPSPCIPSFVLHSHPNPPHLNNSDLDSLVKQWTEGALSNFDYIYSLNRLSGRKYGDPRCHFVFPWVTDFSNSDGTNWRDLTKSKFRLNKGDRQLDVTYESVLPTGILNQVPHHVSDVLSEITYYVYLARQTPKEVLCTYVRPKWVPGEYPSSIQRLQEWTPDECIPEFFTDPNVFKSIHSDLPDLELPPWASDPVLFISVHRGMLESQYVSERLNHWIDLTFGYKLTGTAAVKSKNVCLQLVDNHTHLTSHGIVPLFSTPHPQRLTPSPYFGKNPPRLTAIYRPRSPYEEDESLPADLDDEETTALPVARPLALSRFLSRSKNSLLGSTSSTQQHISTSPSSDSIFSHSLASSNALADPKPSHPVSHLSLPKDYNPVYLLNNMETLYGFMNKTCYKHVDEVNGKRTMDRRERGGDQCDSGGESGELNSTQERVGQLEYSQKNGGSNTKACSTECDTSSDSSPSCDPMESSIRQIAKYRLREMLLLGCLIVELFLNGKCKPFERRGVEFNRRLRSDVMVLRNNWTTLPRCVANAVRVLFNYTEEMSLTDLCLDSFKYPPVNEHGIAPLSAHQLLIPSLTCIWFPASFSQMYVTLKAVASYDALIADIMDIKVNEPRLFDSKRPVLSSTYDQLIEMKVKTLAASLESLAESQASSTSSGHWLTVVVPYVQNMLQDKSVQLQAAWYLLEPVTRSLGPHKSTELFLPLVAKLYDSSDERLEPTDKRAKLYHRSFLLRLMLRFGLGNFLEHFIVALVEAVGGYQDVNTDQTQHKTLLGNEDTGGGISSPLDEDSSAASEQNNTSVASEHQAPDNHENQTAEPEMFVMEEPTPPEDPTLEDGYHHVELLLEQLDDPHWLTDEDEPPSPSSGGAGSPLQHKLRPNESVEVRRSGGSEACRISDVSAESLIWLSHRLGPVLTARYITRNLLRMLSLCYMGGEALRAREGGRLKADVNAGPVLDTLTSIAGLYGEQFIVLQYIPHVAELIALCKRTRVTPTLEGGLVASMALLKHTIPYLTVNTLTEIMQDVLCKNILHPCIRLLSSTKFLFPNGFLSRSCLAVKLIDCLYMLSLRIPNRQLMLIVPALQRFFQVFDKVHRLKTGGLVNVDDGNVDDVPTKMKSSIELLLHQDDLKGNESAESLSPPPSLSNAPGKEKHMEKVIEELSQVFSPGLAHLAYIPFLRYFKDSFMETSLLNHDLIKSLSHEAAQQEAGHDGVESDAMPITSPSDIHSWVETLSQDTGSFGTVKGNRIEIQDPDVLSAEVTRKMEYTTRHLRGNWRAYWEHEIGKPASAESRFNIAHVKLQTFSGHMNSVKCLHVMDNENSFMSASRDKTVKLWTLRNQGDGSATTSPQWTYSYHRKSVLALSFIDRLRLVASCDSVIHFWDPWVGRPIQVLEKLGPVNTLKALPPPHSSILAATTDPALRLVDARSPNPSSCEFKISINPIGLIRCIAVSSNASWIAIGQASGVLTLLDLRTGTVLASWKGHEGEILQLVAADDGTLVSSSLDQTISAWHSNDGSLKCNIQGPTEPVHCLSVYKDQVISSTTANRLGSHSLSDYSFSCTKLRSDSFKGIVTTMALVPLNKLVLLGADNGNITLFC